MNTNNNEFITITIDKSHIITIGERLYTESIEFVREIVNNEVHADFLPITSDRTGFIKDSPEYEAFQKVMERVIGDVKTTLQKLSGKKEGRKVSRALKETLQKIYKALAANPDLSPFGAFPVGEEATNAKCCNQEDEIR